MTALLALASFAAALLLSSALNWLAMIPWRRSVGAHWTERARRLFPMRAAALLSPWLFAANAGVAAQILAGDVPFQWLPAALAAWVGSALSGYFSDRAIWPGVSFKDWFGQFILYALFFQTSLLFTAIGLMVMPSHFGWQCWLIAGVIVTIKVLLVFGLTVRILRWTNVIQPAPASLHAAAMQAAERAGAKLGHVWLNRGPAAHAFALLPMKDMLFSERLLQVLTNDEVASVCAHEAAHLTESNWIFAGRLAGAFALVPLIFIVPAIGQLGLPGIIGLVVVTLLLMRLAVWLARRMEKRADAAATQETADPAVYARALEKLYETNVMPAVMPKRSKQVHPDLYDRMIAVGVTPSYERPKPPSKSSWSLSLLVAAFILQLIALSTVKDSARREWRTSTRSASTNAP